MKKKRYKILIAVPLLIVLAVGVDYLIGLKQDSALQQKSALKKKLERLAWYNLRSDIKNVSYEGDTYRVTLRFENPFPEEELFIMTPSVRCLVQVGTYWKEVPVHEVGNKQPESSVIKLEKPYTIDKLIEVPFRNFEEVLPGYMHVRINSISYVSSNAISKEDIAEKNEDFYIYLKPYFADDKEVSRKYAFTNNAVPIWIPMPPH
ncbi:MAG: hypothetical protein M0Z79_12915 [Nitrospiraceae bacterium]|nr:hypothetical protein [Nitrospiraceae bacterium]